MTENVCARILKMNILKGKIWSLFCGELMRRWNWKRKVDKLFQLTLRNTYTLIINAFPDNTVSSSASKYGKHELKEKK